MLRRTFLKALPPLLTGPNLLAACANPAARRDLERYTFEVGNDYHTIISTDGNNVVVGDNGRASIDCANGDGILLPPETDDLVVIPQQDEVVREYMSTATQMCNGDRLTLNNPWDNPDTFIQDHSTPFIP